MVTCLVEMTEPHATKKWEAAPGYSILDTEV